LPNKAVRASEKPGGRHDRNFNGLLLGKGIDPQDVLLLRRRPHEPELNKVLEWLAAAKPDVFYVYQQTQKGRLEKFMEVMKAGGAPFPTRWKSALSQWWAIYYIFDTSYGKAYVGSAYGENNVLGRWLNYAARGRGH
jgi:hypothetical protein